MRDIEREYEEILSGLDLEDRLHVILLMEDEIAQGGDPDEVLWEYLSSLEG